MGASSVRLRTRNEPTALAEAPNVMNTIENPVTNASAEREQAAARRLALLQLLHADARKHRDISRHQRQNTRREKRHQPRHKRREYGNVHQVLVYARNAHRGDSPIAIFAHSLDVAAGRSVSGQSSWKSSQFMANAGWPVRGERLLQRPAQLKAGAPLPNAVRSAAGPRADPAPRERRTEPKSPEGR
jgi:hypothetical protein